MRQLDGMTDSMGMSLSKIQEMVREAWHAAKSTGRKEWDMTEQMNNNRITPSFHWKVHGYFQELTWLKEEELLGAQFGIFLSYLTMPM